MGLCGPTVNFGIWRRNPFSNQEEKMILVILAVHSQFQTESDEDSGNDIVCRCQGGGKMLTEPPTNTAQTVCDSWC